MTLPSPARVLWHSAELLIAFHKNKQRKKRDVPFLWRPKDAIARLLARPEDQEAFVVLKAAPEAEGVQDVQIKMHPDKVVVRRDQPHGWSGIIIEEHVVRIRVDNDWIEVQPDGGVTVKRDAETTYLEGDGSIIKINPDTKITVSSDGGSIARRTDTQIDAFTPEGFVSRKKEKEKTDVWPGVSGRTAKTE